jgi:hypothetical protein
MSENQAGCTVIGGFILYVVGCIAFWLWMSLSIVAPWLTSLGLVAWASAIVALAGVGFATFWLALIMFYIVIAIGAALLK